MNINNNTVNVPITMPMITLSLLRLLPIIVMTPFSAGICDSVEPIRFDTFVSIRRCS